MVSAHVSRSPVCAWRLVPPVQQQVSARRHGKLPRRPATERPASSAFREPPLRFQPVSSAPMGCKSSPGCSGAAAMAAADVLLPLDESSRNVGRSSRHQVARRRHASSAHPGQHGPRHGLQPSGAAVEVLRRPQSACGASPVAHCAPRRWVRRLPGGRDITYRRFLHRAALPTPAAGRASQNTARTASLRPRGLDYGLPALRIWNSGSTRTQQADTAEIAVGPCPTRPSGTGPGRFSPLSWRHGPWCSASDPPSLKESAGPLRSGHRGP